MSGWDICRAVRRVEIDIPILMLSALDEPWDKVRGLDAGADDFLGKPFDTEELLARIRALLRKKMVHRGQRIHIEDLEIDRDSRTAVRCGTDLNLTESEFEILAKLASHEGLLLQKEKLANHVVLNTESTGDPFESCMASLRAKVDGPFHQPLIRGCDDSYILCVLG